MKICYTFLGLALYLQGAACYAGQYVLQTGGIINASKTVSDAKDFSAPNTSSYASIGNSVNYDTHFEWVPTGIESPSAFTTLASVALTGSVTARAVTGPTYTYGASASGYGQASYGGAQTPSNVNLQIYAPAYAPDVDTGVLKDETPPARVFYVTSGYAFQGNQSVYLSTVLGVNGSVGAGASDPGSRATATGSLTNTTDITLENSAGGGYGGYGY